MIRERLKFHGLKNLNEILFLIFFSFLPLSFIAGNLFINLFFIFFLAVFFIKFKNKKINFKDPIIKLNLFLILTLIINLLFSMDQLNSLPRVLKFILYFILIIELKNFVKNNQIIFEEKIIKYWVWIFLVIIFDISFEVYFGYNMIGYTSYYPGRIASFFDDELVVGSFFLTFSLITLNYIIELKKYPKIIIISYIIFLIVISYLIGERSNFIKFFISICIFTLIVLKPKIKELISIFLAVVTLVLTFSYFKSSYSSRYYHTVNEIIKNKDINSYLKNSQYGAHYDGAYQIYKSFPIFGVGIKNFRNEVHKEKYISDDYSLTNQRWATHPHQVHYELLSETGIFGYLTFLSFIIISVILSLKNYLQNKNNYQLASIIIVFVSMLPLLPSGSIFSTFAGGLFWINYGIMVAYNKSKIN